MGDEKIMKMKSFRKGEEIFLMRSCLKDGMTQTQAKSYIEEMRQEVKNNHESYNKKINQRKKKSFKEEFKKLKNERKK